MHADAAASSLPSWLAHRAATTPARTALVTGGRSWSYGELHAEADRMARRIASFGVGQGDRVATCLNNGTDAALLPHALLRLGAVLVPLNTRLSATELAWQIEDADARLLLADRRTSERCMDAAVSQPAVKLVGVDDESASAFGGVPLCAQEEADVRLLDARDADSVCAIVYTSGTTGTPKGAMLTVGNFWWSAIGSALNIGVHEQDRWLACLPLFHVGGLSILFRSAIYGTTAVIHDGFDERAVNRALDEDGISIVSVVSVMLRRMLAEREDRGYPSSLRCVLLGGGPAPHDLLERCSRLRVPVVQSYGLTETASQVATLAPDDAMSRAGSAGRPLYPNELRIVEDDRPVAQGGMGEIVVRGPIVMAGYFRQPSETTRAIRNGWLHTGDLGRLDPDGYLYVLDRRDDLIITGGENVYPAEVEAVLLAHEMVEEAGVIGLPDAEWGHRVTAVVRMAGASGDDSAGVASSLAAHCRSRLAGFKVPHEIHLSEDSLPRTASGKLRRSELREMIARKGTSP